MGPMYRRCTVAVRDSGLFTGPVYSCTYYLWHVFVAVVTVTVSVLVKTMQRGKSR